MHADIIQENNLFRKNDEWWEREAYRTRVGDTGRPVADGGRELTGPRLGDTAPVTSLSLAMVRSRICRCSFVSGTLCKVTSQWPCIMDVCRQNTRPRRTLELRRFETDVTASGRSIRSLRPR